jgi:hypothetical protein
METQNQTQRVILLNSLPLNSLPRRPLRLRIQPIPVDEIGRYIQGRQVIHYIRHQSTLNVLSRIVHISPQPNSGLYAFQEGDRLIVISLRAPVRGAEQTVDINDLESWVVDVEVES